MESEARLYRKTTHLDSCTDHLSRTHIKDDKVRKLAAIVVVWSAGREYESVKLTRVFVDSLCLLWKYPIATCNILVGKAQQITRQRSLAEFEAF
jgi:hypothetical protein